MTKVVKIIDSNTFETETGQRVCLAGVNACEVGNATKKLYKLVHDKCVSIEPVGVNYGRVVAKVLVNGISVNSKMRKSIIGQDKSSRPIIELFTMGIVEDFAGIQLCMLTFLDEEFVIPFQHRMNEAELCLAAQCPLAAIVLYGSILEGVLLKYAEYYLDRCKKTKPRPKSNKISNWRFAKLIKVLRKAGLLELDTLGYVEILRKSRNHVHIHLQIANKVNLSKSLASMCELNGISPSAVSVNFSEYNASNSSENDASNFSENDAIMYRDMFIKSINRIKEVSD